MRILIRVSILLFVYSLMNVSFAQDMPLFAHLDYNLDTESTHPIDLTLLTIETGTESILTRYPQNIFFNLMWNNDGTQLAMLGEVDIIFDIPTESVLPIPQFAIQNSVYTLAWTEDNDFVMGRYPQGDYSQVELFLETPGADTLYENVTVLGSNPYGTGCGGGTDIPVQMLYQAEDEPELFVVTEFGIIHPTSCAGGYALFDVGSQTDTELPSWRNPVLSADRVQVAGTTFVESQPVMTITNLATLESTDYSIPDAATATAWSADGEIIYFATRQLETDFRETLTDEQQEDFNDIFGREIPLDMFSVQIHALTLATGEIETIYENAANGITRMYVIDGNIYAVEIPNQDAWIEPMVITGEMPSPLLRDVLRYLVPSVQRIPTDDPSSVTTLGQYLKFTPYTGDQ